MAKPEQVLTPSPLTQDTMVRDSAHGIFLCTPPTHTHIGFLLISPYRPHSPNSYNQLWPLVIWLQSIMWHDVVGCKLYVPHIDHSSVIIYQFYIVCQPSLFLRRRTPPPLLSWRLLAGSSVWLTGTWSPFPALCPLPAGSERRGLQEYLHTQQEHMGLCQCTRMITNSMASSRVMMIKHIHLALEKKYSLLDNK